MVGIYTHINTPNHALSSIKRQTEEVSLNYFRGVLSGTRREVFVFVFVKLAEVIYHIPGL